MKAILKAKLESAIAAALDDIGEHPDRPDGYWHESLCFHMASAAEAVFDATVASSVFTADEMAE